MDVKDYWLGVSQDGQKVVAVKPEGGIVVEGTMGQIVFEVKDVHPDWINMFLAAPAMRTEIANAYNILALLSDECGQLMAPAVFDVIKQMQDSFLMRIIHVDKGIDEAASALRAELAMKGRSSPHDNS